MTSQQDVEREFYGRALAKAKFGHESTGYGLPINQKMRFDEWRKQVIVPYQVVHGTTEPMSILDIGSGTGDLIPYMEARDIAYDPYLGVDIMPEMTETARGRFPNEHRIRFETADIANYGDWPAAWFPPAIDGFKFDGFKFDHVVSIAAYALKAPHDSQKETIADVQYAIEHMVEAARHSVFVTLFSTWKTNVIPEEMVLDPVTMFAWAKTKWERVDLIHSYAPFDFSLVIQLDDSDWRAAWQAQSGD